MTRIENSSEGRKRKNPIQQAIEDWIVGRGIPNLEEFAKQIGERPSSVRGWITKEHISERFWEKLKEVGVVPKDADPSTYGCSLTSPRRVDAPTPGNLLQQLCKEKKIDDFANQLTEDEQRKALICLLANKNLDSSFDRFCEQGGGTVTIVKPFRTGVDSEPSGLDWDMPFNSTDKGRRTVNEARRDLKLFFGSKFFVERVQQLLQNPSSSCHIIITVDDDQYIADVQRWITENFQQMFGPLSSRIKVEVVPEPPNTDLGTMDGVWLQVSQGGSVDDAWRMLDRYTDVPPGKKLLEKLPGQGKQHTAHLLATTYFSKIETPESYLLRSSNAEELIRLLARMRPDSN